MTYRDIDPKLAGIYIFRNNINNKCYIGQSICIRKRIKSHLKSIDKLKLPLYTAIQKYGIHNFTIDILYSFIPDESTSTEDLVKKLDALEIEYIKEYDSYNNGYNCTLGGDYGVLGLKMTDAQKKVISDKAKISAQKLYKSVYLYNITEKSIIYAISITAASNITKINRTYLQKAAQGKLKTTKNYIVAYSKEELDKKILNSSKYNNSKFVTKYSLILHQDNKEIFLNDVKEAAEYLNLSKSMIYQILSGNKKGNGFTIEKILK